MLGLGSNLGARRALLSAAIELLGAAPCARVLARSALYQTPALGPPQPDYLNAAVRVAWCGSLEGLFALTQHIEQLLGRERRVRWGPRTLDIDVLHWSEGPCAAPTLTVPHARLFERNFALAPLLDVMPERAPELEPALSALGGRPPLASPGWLSVPSSMAAAESAQEFEVPALDDEAEIACLAVGAVGACARTPARARTSLAFASSAAPFTASGESTLTHLVSAASHAGFRTSCAAITSVSPEGTRGYLVGEHTATKETQAAPQLWLQRDARGRPQRFSTRGPR